MNILETHRWAESPKSELPRIIAADLGNLRNPERVSAYPQNAGLEALWVVRGSDGGAPKTDRTVVSEPVGAAAGSLPVAENLQ